MLVRSEFFHFMSIIELCNFIISSFAGYFAWDVRTLMRK